MSQQEEARSATMTMDRPPLERIHLSKVYLQRELPQRDPREDVYESLPSLTDVSSNEPKQPDYTKNIPGIPPEALPVVLTLPLEQTMPILKGPKGKNTLYTTYVGETYYRRPEENVDFDLTDLEGNYYSLKNDYNLLTDTHLKPFLRQHHIRDNLADRGLLTDDGRVVVNVKDYNEFRRYLRHYNCAISKKADELARAYEAERNPKITEAQKMAIALADGSRKRNEQAQAVRERLEQQRVEQRLRYVRKAKEQERRLKRLQERDMDEALEKEAMNRLIEEKRKQVIRRNALEERKRQLQTIKRWIEDEQTREQRARERQKELADEKARKLRESWAAHKSYQQEILEMEAKRRRELEEERRKHVHYRDIAFHRRRQQQQGSFQKIAEARRKHRKQVDEEYLRNYNNRIQEMRSKAARKKGKIHSPASASEYRHWSNWDLESSLRREIDTINAAWPVMLHDTPNKDRHGRQLGLDKLGIPAMSTPRLCDTLQKYINEMGVGDFVGARFLLPQWQPGTPAVPAAQQHDEHVDVSLGKYERDSGSAIFDEKAFYNKRRVSGPGPKQSSSPSVDLSKWPLKEQSKKSSFGNGDITGFNEEEELVNIRNSQMQVEAAGSYVKIVVYLASQVFYPAYLTYLEQKKPDIYDQQKVILEKYTDPKRIMTTKHGREPGYALVLFPLDGTTTGNTARLDTGTAAGRRLAYTKHYISDYIIKKGKSKKKRRKQKKAARAVNTLMTIIRRVLEELDSGQVAPDQVQALARYAKDTLDVNADAKTTSALAQSYMESATSMHEPSPPSTVDKSGSQASQVSNISGVTMYVKQALDKVVSQLQQETSEQRKLSDADQASLVADRVVDYALDECRIRLTAEGERQKTIVKDSDHAVDANDRRAQLEHALADAASLIAQILADTIEKFLTRDAEPSRVQPETVASENVVPPSAGSAPSESEPTASPKRVETPSPDLGYFIDAPSSVESQLATNLVDGALRNAVADIGTGASDSIPTLAHPDGEEISEFRPVEPFYGDLPLPINSDIVSESLSIISVKRDADLDLSQTSCIPCMRNSFRSLINPDVSRIKRIMAPTREEASRNFIALAKRRFSVGSNEPHIPNPAAEKQRHTVGNRETISEDFLKWLCDNARHGGEDDIPEENEPEDEEGRSGSASSGETEVVMSTISIVVDDAQPRPPATQSPYPRSTRTSGSRGSTDSCTRAAKIVRRNTTSRTTGYNVVHKPRLSNPTAKESLIKKQEARPLESSYKQSLSRESRPFMTAYKPSPPRLPLATVFTPSPPNESQSKVSDAEVTPRRSRPIKVNIPLEPKPPSSLASRSSVSSKSRRKSSKSRSISSEARGLSRDSGDASKKGTDKKRKASRKKRLIKDSIDDSILEEEIDSDGERLEDRGARQKSVDDGVIGDMEKGMVDENIGEKEESVVDEHFKRNEISDIEGEMGVYEKTEIEGDVGASEKNVTEEITDASEKTDIGEDVDAANDNEDSGSTDVPGESVIDADAKARRRTVVEPLIVKEYSHPLDSTSGHRKDSVAREDSVKKIRVRMAARISDVGKRQTKKRKSVVLVPKRRRKSIVREAPYY